MVKVNLASGLMSSTVEPTPYSSNTDSMSIKHTYDPNMTTAEYLAWNGQLASQGMAEKAARGEYPGCAPLGYTNVKTNEGNTVEIDPTTAPLVREAFLLSAKGLSLRKIVGLPTEKGLRSRNGGLLDPPAPGTC